MGTRQRVKRAITALLIGGIIGGTTIAIGAVPAVIVTNAGQVAEGSLTGLGSVIRLQPTDGARSIGPDAQFDVLLISIRQITLDFPRIVIETADRTLIGPYSSFSGISQALHLDRAGEPSVTIPTSSLRAITLNGHSLQPAPRVWVGNGFLSMPRITGVSPLVAAECDKCTIGQPQTDADADLTIWNGLSPGYVPEEPEELPWWVGLLGVAALIVISYLLTSTGGASS